MIIKFFRKLFGLCIHDWTKWERSPKLWTSVDTFTSERRLVAVQIKNCKNCGLEKVRKVAQ